MKSINNPSWTSQKFVDGVEVRWDPKSIHSEVAHRIRNSHQSNHAVEHLIGYSAEVWEVIYPTNKLPEPAFATLPSEGEHSGGSVNYYKVQIDNPDSEGVEPYQAECTDIIEALGMTFAEANIFKEVWRTAAARTLGKKKAGHDALYGAEKIEYYAARNLRKVKRTHSK